MLDSGIITGFQGPCLFATNAILLHLCIRPCPQPAAHLVHELCRQLRQQVMVRVRLLTRRARRRCQLLQGHCRHALHRGRGAARVRLHAIGDKGVVMGGSRKVTDRRV